MENLTQSEINEAMTKTFGNKAGFKAACKKYGFAAAVSAALMSNAHAAATPIEITSVTDTITSGVTTVSAIGLAVLSLVVVIKVFKWARSAM